MKLAINTGLVDRGALLALLASLSRLTGRPVHGTLAHAKLPIESLAGLSAHYPTDHHPSRRGSQFYAEVVTAVLLRHGYARQLN